MVYKGNHPNICRQCTNKMDNIGDNGLCPACDNQSTHCKEGCKKSPTLDNYDEYYDGYGSYDMLRCKQDQEHFILSAK